MIIRYQRFINENVVNRLIDYCEDIIQEIVDEFHLKKLDVIQTNWSEFWSSENGWYNVEDVPDQKDEYFNERYVKIKIQFCVSKSISGEVSKNIDPIRNKLDKLGLITKYSFLNKENSTADNIYLSIYLRKDFFKNINI